MRRGKELILVGLQDYNDQGNASWHDCKIDRRPVFLNIPTARFSRTRFYFKQKNKDPQE